MNVCLGCLRRICVCPCPCDQCRDAARAIEAGCRPAEPGELLAAPADVDAYTAVRAAMSAYGLDPDR